jgi:hypothetical protein
MFCHAFLVHSFQGHCIPYEQAMQKALQKKGLFPV